MAARSSVRSAQHDRYSGDLPSGGTSPCTSSAGSTPSPAATFSRLCKRRLRCPRSTCPRNVQWTPARLAATSWLIPRASRRVRTRSPRALVAGESGFGIQPNLIRPDCLCPEYLRHMRFRPAKVLPTLPHTGQARLGHQTDSRSLETICANSSYCANRSNKYSLDFISANKEGLPKRLDRPSHSRIYASSPIRSHTGSDGAVGPCSLRTKRPYSTENSDGRAHRNRQNRRICGKSSASCLYFNERKDGRILDCLLLLKYGLVCDQPIVGQLDRDRGRCAQASKRSRSLDSLASISRIRDLSRSLLYTVV
jgi:hypothetical protein